MKKNTKEINMNPSKLSELLSALPDSLLLELILSLGIDSDIDNGTASKLQIGHSIMDYFQRRSQLGFLEQTLIKIAPGISNFECRQQVLTERNRLAEEILRNLGLTRVESIAASANFRKYLPKNLPSTLIPFYICHLALALDKVGDLK